ncbi:hypothetical protein Herbaro_17205 [Herbaspirillum sp. WKF16]|jgi:hypothetical protein|uniref:hypothetical protein n=1 Tax=Herbaspirillum sp. WKF16 TaxID=3028312 RepID=UPI0023A95E04|nr:hypothetical protein [Herbaspirillum sp. WKF16]WDZ95211.1 hypothetical protein Herbaro_17205 [Herbaspirillum sp. WKF16]
MQKRTSLIKTLHDLKTAHDAASDALGRIARTAVVSENGEAVSPMLEFLQDYQDALKEAKRQALHAQVILSDL